MGDTVRAVRVPDGALRSPRELAPGEVTRDKEGFWYVRPPAPGYLQPLNRAAYTVTIEGNAADAPITVAEPIVQRMGAWRLEAGVWTPEAQG
jgi:hypothetical protein